MRLLLINIFKLTRIINLKKVILKNLHFPMLLYSHTYKRSNV